MTAPAERPTSSSPGGGSANPAENDAQRIGQLRGAGVQVNGRSVAAVAIGLVLLTLLALSVAFLISGIQKNQQINELQSKGVPVTVTVTNCLGLLGGSGSNAAGYSCEGTYAVDGHTYTEQLPGLAFHARGESVAALAVPGDPAVVSPVNIVRTEHTSANVFILPAVLFVVFLAGVLVVLLWRRRAATSTHN